MPDTKQATDLVLDLEKRIDAMQDMDESQLGTFGRLDWIILIVVSIIIPVIVLVAAR